MKAKRSLWPKIVALLFCPLLALAEGNSGNSSRAQLDPILQRNRTQLTWLMYVPVVAELMQSGIADKDKNCLDQTMARWLEEASTGKWAHSTLILRPLMSDACSGVTNQIISPEYNSASHLNYLKVLLENEYIIDLKKRKLANLEAARLMLALGRPAFSSAVEVLTGFYLFDPDPDVNQKALAVRSVNKSQQRMRPYLALLSTDMLVGLATGVGVGVKAVDLLTQAGLMLTRNALIAKGVVYSAAGHGLLVQAISSNANSKPQSLDLRQIERQRLQRSEALEDFVREFNFDLLNTTMFENLLGRTMRHLDRYPKEPISLAQHFVQLEINRVSRFVSHDHNQILKILANLSEEVSEILHQYREGSELDGVNKARSYIFSQTAVRNYTKTQPYMLEFFHGGSGNCDANTKLMLSVFWEARHLLPKGWVLGVQNFADHIQPVIYNAREKIVYDLVSGFGTKGVITPIFHPYLYLNGHLRKLQNSHALSWKRLLIARADKEFFSSDANMPSYDQWYLRPFSRVLIGNGLDDVKFGEMYFQPFKLMTGSGPGSGSRGQFDGPSYPVRKSLGEAKKCFANTFYSPSFLPTDEEKSTKDKYKPDSTDFKNFSFFIEDTCRPLPGQPSTVKIAFATDQLRALALTKKNNVDLATFLQEISSTDLNDIVAQTDLVQRLYQGQSLIEADRALFHKNIKEFHNKNFHNFGWRLYSYMEQLFKIENFRLEIDFENRKKFRQQNKNLPLADSRFRSVYTKIIELLKAIEQNPEQFVRQWDRIPGNSAQKELYADWLNKIFGMFNDGQNNRESFISEYELIRLLEEQVLKTYESFITALGDERRIGISEVRTEKNEVSPIPPVLNSQNGEFSLSAQLQKSKSVVAPKQISVTIESRCSESEKDPSGRCRTDITPVPSHVVAKVYIPMATFLYLSSFYQREDKTPRNLSKRWNSALDSAYLKAMIKSAHRYINKLTKVSGSSYLKHPVYDFYLSDTYEIARIFSESFKTETHTIKGPQFEGTDSEMKAQFELYNPLRKISKNLALIEKCHTSISYEDKDPPIKYDFSNTESPSMQILYTDRDVQIANQWKRCIESIPQLERSK